MKLFHTNELIIEEGDNCFRIIQGLDPTNICTCDFSGTIPVTKVKSLDKYLQDWSQIIQMGPN